MADQKITQLNTLTNADAAPGDFAVVVDVSDTTMAASGTTKKMALSDLSNYVNSTQQFSFSWDSATTSPAAVAGGPTAPQVSPIHQAMRRCVVNDAGVVQYYLSATNSALKTDGSPSVLTGADGQVMVEIPKFYARRSLAGTVTTWSISAAPLDGYVVHPAFVKDGVEVNFRYYGAYDACVYDTSAAAYVDGLNLDNGDSLYVYGSDVLSSVAGKYPAVGITRAQARQMAGNRGTGWRLVDFWLVNAVQMLYLVEHQTFFSQNVLGAGNTNGSYLASSAVQADSPHTIAGASNALGNGSTNTTTGAGVSAKPGTSFMSYRGIENFYGNAWNWVDGFNIFNNQASVSNSVPFDDTSYTTNGYSTLGAPMPAANNYVRSHQDIDNAYLPASVTGASATTGWTDQYFQASGARVALFGGNASSGVDAGALFWRLSYGSGVRDRLVASRLAR